MADGNVHSHNHNYNHSLQECRLSSAALVAVDRETQRVLLASAEATTLLTHPLSLSPPSSLVSTPLSMLLRAVTEQTFDSTATVTVMPSITATPLTAPTMTPITVPIPTTPVLASVPLDANLHNTNTNASYVLVALVKHNMRRALACKHALSAALSASFLRVNNIDSPNSLSATLVDVWLLEDVSAINLIHSRILNAISLSSQNILACLYSPDQSVNAYQENLHARSLSVPPSFSRVPILDQVPLPSHQYDCRSKNDTTTKNSMLAKADLFIVAAEQSIVSAAGIIGLSSVPLWLFSQIRQYTIPPQYTTSIGKGVVESIPLSTRNPETLISTIQSSHGLENNRAPQITLRINEFGRIEQCCPITTFLGNNTHILLNRYIMRFVNARDVAKLCGGLAKASKIGSAEFYVRWDWRSLCESIPEMEDDNSSHSPENSNDSNNEKSESENNGSVFFDNTDNESDEISANELASEISGAVSVEVLGPRHNRINTPFSKNTSATTLIVENEPPPILPVPTEQAEIDPTISEYQSQQPTRRHSFVEPRFPPLSTLPPDTSKTSSCHSTESADSNTVGNDPLSSVVIPPPSLIWVRILVAKSNIVTKTTGIGAGEDDDNRFQNSLICIITPVPSNQSRRWPKFHDISDSTLGNVDIGHESGPWVECFDDKKNDVGRGRKVVASLGVVSGIRLGKAGVFERVTLRVLGSVMKYSLTRNRSNRLSDSDGGSPPRWFKWGFRWRGLSFGASRANEGILVRK